MRSARRCAQILQPDKARAVRQGARHIESCAACRAHKRPFAELAEHVHLFARGDRRAVLRGIGRTVLHRRLPERRGALGDLGRSLFAAQRQHADFILGDVAAQLAQRHLHIVGLRVLNDAHLRARAQRAQRLRMDVRRLQHHHRHVVVVRLRHTDALARLRQRQFAQLHIAEIAAVIRARTAFKRAHIAVFPALGEHFHLHVLAQRHVRLRLLTRRAVQQNVVFGLHQQRIVRHDAARLIAQGKQTAGLCVLDPAGHTAHTHPAPLALLAAKEVEAGCAVLQRQNLVGTVVRRAVQDRPAVRLGARDHADLELAHVRQAIQRHIAERLLPVHLRGDVRPIVQHTHQRYGRAAFQLAELLRLRVGILQQRKAAHPHAREIDLGRAVFAERAVLAIAPHSLLLRDQVFRGHVARHAADADLGVFLVFGAQVFHLRTGVVQAQNRAVLRRLRPQVQPLGIDLVRLPVVHKQALTNAGRRHAQKHDQRQDQLPRRFHQLSHSFCMSFAE